MRSLFKKSFYIPKHGKILEKTMITHVAITAIIMIICLSAITFTAYAYFAFDVSSHSNIIKSANLKTEVKIQLDDENGAEKALTTNTDIFHQASIDANTTYFITIELSEKSTVKNSFCIITAGGCEKEYHTQQLSFDEQIGTSRFTFKIKSNANTTIKIMANWGTSSYYGNDSTESGLYIQNGDVINIDIEKPDEEKTEILTNSTESNEENNSSSESSDTNSDIQSNPSMEETDSKTENISSESSSSSNESTEISSDNKIEIPSIDSNSNNETSISDNSQVSSNDTSYDTTQTESVTVMNSEMDTTTSPDTSDVSDNSFTESSEIQQNHETE